MKTKTPFVNPVMAALEQRRDNQVKKAIVQLMELAPTLTSALTGSSSISKILQTPEAIISAEHYPYNARSVH